MLLQAIFTKCDHLGRGLHLFKGAAGGYGFDPIGDCAARLEDDMLDDEIDIAGLSERVEDLITTCRAANCPALGP